MDTTILIDVGIGTIGLGALLYIGLKKVKSRLKRYVLRQAAEEKRD